MKILKFLMPVALIGTIFVSGGQAYAENKTDSSSTPIEKKANTSQSLDGGSAKTEEKTAKKTEETPKTSLDKKETKPATEEKLPQAGAEDGLIAGGMLASALAMLFFFKKKKRLN